jgi:hypothetical protein
MEALITIIIIAFVIYFIYKAAKPKEKTNHSEALFDIKITTSRGGLSNSEIELEKFPPIEQDKNSYWILNPGAPFELTLMTKDKDLALEVRELLDSEDQRDYKKKDYFVEMFAVNNLKIKEVEEYKEKYKGQYFNKIQDLIEISTEWEKAGDKDKEDLMKDFREEAIKEIYERADCDLPTLFECEPTNMNIDDELIKTYGFKNIQFYLRNADKLDKVRVIPNDNYSRPIFENLHELGLAYRGYDLPKDEILKTLKLKELNAIAQNPDKEYKRKNQAIDYILSKNNVDELIGKYISLREIFKLKPLPEKYKNFDLSTLENTWNYHREEVRLLMLTYRNSYYSWRDLKDDEYVKNYKVEPLDKENPCPCAKDLSKKKYSKNKPPRIPYHVGCNCFLNRNYDLD